MRSQRLDAGNAQTQVGKMLATQGSAYDAVYVSPGQTRTLIENGFISKIDNSRIPSWSKLDPRLQDEWGVPIHLEVDGIVYNPTKVPKPKGYRDLFENPAFDNRISFLGFFSNAATVAWVEIAKAYGGSAENLDPMFEVLEKYLPKIGAISNSGAQQQSLYQQGEVDVFIGSTGNAARLRQLGVPVDYASPDTGSQALPVYVHLSAKSAEPDAVYEYMETMISTDVQKALATPPTSYFPTNLEVDLPKDVSDFFQRDDVPSLVFPDWAAINANRAKWSEQFDRTVSH